MRTAAVAIAILIAFMGQAPAGAPHKTPQQVAQLPAGQHLVYRFGYNTKAEDSGQGTGDTTIDIVGPAKDGGIVVNASDFWWNTPRARQTYTCEVYPNGGVTCAQPPHAVSPIQIVLLPLLGKNVFTSLGVGSTSTLSYDVKATFAPIGTSGFAGQVHTWSCSYTMTVKKNVGNGTPFVLVGQQGQMKQQTGRQIIVNQDGNVVVDPSTKIPVHVFQSITFIPKKTTNSYSVDLKLKEHKP